MLHERINIVLSENKMVSSPSRIISRLLILSTQEEAY